VEKQTLRGEQSRAEQRKDGKKERRDNGEGMGKDIRREERRWRVYER